MALDREKVAERLREKHEEYAASGFFEVQDVGMQAHDRLKDLIGCLPDGEDVFVTLADLIDPTCEMQQSYMDSSPELDECMDGIASSPEDTVACICQGCG